ncbi:hypothetical protein D0Z00_004507 [Geotrichum galactomycetum]|uniref:Uncharacterized protein n=1 Tax=Geotrichum galactomycetum TaxID=27317 RepID=A0ACB6UY86_9ASCO|nr:hypothetical protein D0Z00_004507 [Geotrichum candidum]
MMTKFSTRCKKNLSTSSVPYPLQEDDRESTAATLSTSGKRDFSAMSYDEWEAHGQALGKRVEDFIGKLLAFRK